MKVDKDKINHLSNLELPTASILRRITDLGWTQRAANLAHEWNDLIYASNEIKLKDAKLRSKIKDLYCELFKREAKDERPI